MEKKPFLRAQGATEYLVLLAVVLVIALVSIALLGFFPGLANDARLQQSQMFWKSQPLAIIDGVGGDEGLWVGWEGPDAIKVTLQNNAGYPVQLLAMSGLRGNVQCTGHDCHSLLAMYGTDTIFGDTALYYPAGNYQYFFPGWRYPGYYAYISAPKGTGVGEYTDKMILQPGETVTVGYNVYALNDGNYNLDSCRIWDGNQQMPLKKTMTIKNFNIYYATQIEGKETVKSEMGDLMLPCVDSVGS